MDDQLDSDQEDQKDQKAEETDKGDTSESRFLPSEQRQSEEGRRSDEDRRQADVPIEGEDKRETDDRRTGEDRRDIGLEVTCKTTGSIITIEDWLEDHCEEGWNVILQKIDEDMVQKHVKVMFESEVDRDRFLDKYLKIDKDK